MLESRFTIFVIDDDEAMLDAIKTVSEGAGHLVREFRSGPEFLMAFEGDCHGCVIIDIRMPCMNGLELQEELVRREILLPVIVISGHADVPLTVRAMRTGAIDVLEKPFGMQELLNCINHALAHDLARRTEDANRDMVERNYQELTTREQEVLLFLVQGLAGKQIARNMHISYKTLEKHRASVMQKMQANSVADLVRFAMKLGLATPDGPLS